MSKPWELMTYAEMEARLAAARQLRRDELGPWLHEATRRVVDALTSVGSSDARGPRHPHRSAGHVER